MLTNYAEYIAGIILLSVLAVFTFGKSPVFRVDRTGAAIIGAALMLASGVLSFEQAVRAVDYRTIVVLFSMMVVVANLKVAGFFELVGQTVLKHIRTKAGLLFAVILTGGIISAIAINDIACLLFTPVVLFICRKGNCNPIPHLLGLAMASNIGSAATFLGNPQNILIGNLSRLPFFDYFILAAPVSIAGLLLLFFMLLKAYQKELAGALTHAPYEIHVHPYLTVKSILILAGILISYMLGCDIALVSILGAALLLITRRVKPNKIYISIDFNLLLTFIGLFIIIGGIEASGLLHHVNGLLPAGQMHDLKLFTLCSVLLSNVVSNVPAVLLMQYYIPGTSALHWQSLALFSTIAGNLTVFGSIANLIVVEMAKKQGIIITARAYFIIGCPLTILLSCFAVLWLGI